MLGRSWARQFSSAEGKPQRDISAEGHQPSAFPAAGEVCASVLEGDICGEPWCPL